MKLALGVEYLGSQFSGWQFQGHDPNTIQQNLQEALGFVANHPVTVHASGRTDAGVHALDQVCHFETSAVRDPYSWRQGANTRLPRSIRVKWVQVVDEQFHARFKALFRDYIYVIHKTKVPSAVWGKQVTSWYKPLSPEAMSAACQYFIGEHDFSVFRAASCQAKHPVRRILQADVWQRGDFIAFAIRGNAFLHHMVRNIVGSLLMVGERVQNPEWIQQLLQHGDRSLAGPTAPSNGLYLRATYYSPKFRLPQNSKTPFGLFDEDLQSWPQAYPNVDFGDRL